jgi:hypothetical protein
MNQRWCDRSSSFRSDVIRTSDFDVAEIPDDATARRFVLQHHYSGSYPAARFRFGLYQHGQLAGVAVFSHPCSDRVLTTVFPGDARLSVELGRFVLLDQVAGNGETWFLARCFDLLRDLDITGVVSFSDPVARVTAAGDSIFAGHIGTIYQAHNAVYLGRGTARSLRLLPDGRTFSARTMQKVRAMDRGWRYAVADLEQAGAARLQPGEDPRVWLAVALATTTRNVRHPGNHKYAWGLQRATRRICLPRLAYPKQLDSARPD